MIRKEEVDVRELNRKVHARAQLKPSLDAFPVKDFSVPFNSLRNRHGILKAELEVPKSFTDDTMGVADQINEIRNGNPGVQNYDPSDNLQDFNTETNNEPNENLQLNISDENGKIDNLAMDMVENGKINVQSNQEMVTENQERVIENEESASPAVNQFLNDIKEEITTEPVVDKPHIDNKFIRAVMDIKRNTIVSKTVMVLFLVIMAVLIYFGFHKKI
jgi:hypothetical protein